MKRKALPRDVSLKMKLYLAWKEKKKKPKQKHQPQFQHLLAQVLEYVRKEEA